MTAVTNYDFLRDPDNYVAYWFIKNNLKSTYAIRQPGLFGRLYLDYNREVKAYSAIYKDKIKPSSLVLMQYAYSAYVESNLQKDRNDKIASFCNHSEDLSLLRQFLTAVTGQLRAEDLAVIAHWMWLVKRKALELPVKWHIMPIFFGAQGSGKTDAIFHMTAPLKEYRLDLDIAKLHDDRIYEGFSENFIGFADELQGADKADVNVLKHKITAKELSYRKLHSHIVTTVPMRLSLIGASNRPINENFADSTGLRRFWELITLDKLDWAVIRNLDYNQMWYGINEQNEEGYLTGDVLASVLKTQEGMVIADVYTEFINEVNLLIKEGDETIELDADHLFQQFNQWATINGYKYSVPKNKFCSIFNRKLKSRISKLGGKRTRWFTINAEHGLPKGELTILKIANGGSK
jgi:hypothetical protein